MPKRGAANRLKVTMTWEMPFDAAAAYLGLGANFSVPYRSLLDTAGKPSDVNLQASSTFPEEPIGGASAQHLLRWRRRLRQGDLQPKEEAAPPGGPGQGELASRRG